VEDHELVREMLNDFLQMSGFAVVSVPDAETAVDMLQQQTFDIVLTDYQLPGLNGSDLVQHVHRQIPGVPVVLISSHSHLPEIARASGADAYFEKGRDPSELVQLLNSFAGGEQ
jgi:DNA-binding NarL/FixJ family response regulator